MEYSAGGVIQHNGKIALVSQKGFWSLPKGHLQKNETTFEAAKREIYEETGLTDLTFVRELGEFQRPSRHTRSMKSITLFLFTTTTTDLKPVDKAHPEAKWFTLEEAYEVLRKDDADFLKKNL